MSLPKPDVSNTMCLAVAPTATLWLALTIPILVTSLMVAERPGWPETDICAEIDDNLITPGHPRAAAVITMSVFASATDVAVRLTVTLDNCRVVFLEVLFFPLGWPPGRPWFLFCLRGAQNDPRTRASVSEVGDLPVRPGAS